MYSRWWAWKILFNFSIVCATHDDDDALCVPICQSYVYLLDKINISLDKKMKNLDKSVKELKVSKYFVMFGRDGSVP